MRESGWLILIQFLLKLCPVEGVVVVVVEVWEKYRMKAAIR